MGMFKNISWNGVKEWFSDATDKTEALCKYATEKNAEKFSKQLKNYRFMGTRDANTVRVTAAILNMANSLDKNGVNDGEVKKIFKLLGEGKGAAA